MRGAVYYGDVNRKYTKHSLKSGIRLLMPGQRRLPTLLEMSRAQGFPDSIGFAGMRLEPSIQAIANAVPPPYARALGRALIDALFLEHLANKPCLANAASITQIVRRVEIKQEPED